MRGEGVLDCYTLYLIARFSSNGNIIPVAYARISANESTASWSRFLDFVKKHLRGFSRRKTLTSDWDKGIEAAIATVFADKLPHQRFCLKHRLDNLGKHGPGIREIYKNVGLASTAESVTAIRESAQFQNLTDGGRAAINNCDDAVQCLWACAATGGKSYGRSSSQAVECQNHHIAGARTQDLLSSILWITGFEARRYRE